MKNNIKNLPKRIKDLFHIINLLKEDFNGQWNFTLDGRLFGDIGEAIACYFFDLIKPADDIKHDAKTKNGKKQIQIKITQKKNLGLGIKKQQYEHILAFKVINEKEIWLLYNGPGKYVFEYMKEKKYNYINENSLIELNNKVNLKNRLNPKKKLNNEYLKIIEKY